MAGKKIHKTKNGGKRWKEEDDYLLQDLWGTMSAAGIARKMGRSMSAVINRAYRIGLGCQLDSGADPTLNQVFRTICGKENPGAYVLNRWIKAGLPYKTRLIRACRFKVINLDEFWEWAERNKDLMDFALFERYALGAEPAWVDVKRKADFDKRFKTQPPNTEWSSGEVFTLKRMLEKGGSTWTEIAKACRRTEGACRRRANMLGLDVSKVARTQSRPWSEADIMEMLSMMEAGYDFRQIGEKLGRSARSVEGKFDRLINPRYMTRENRRPGAEKPYTHVRVKGMNPADIREEYESGSLRVPYLETPRIGGAANAE